MDKTLAASKNKYLQSSPSLNRNGGGGGGGQFFNYEDDLSSRNDSIHDTNNNNDNNNSKESNYLTSSSINPSSGGAVSAFKAGDRRELFTTKEKIATANLEYNINSQVWRKKKEKKEMSYL
jgi:hypothetical protein